MAAAAGTVTTAGKVATAGAAAGTAITGGVVATAGTITTVGVVVGMFPPGMAGAGSNRAIATSPLPGPYAWRYRTIGVAALDGRRRRGVPLCGQL